MTYSIVARDADTGELGVAVQTRWPNVGSIVPWAEPGVGAIATQSFAEESYGPLGLTRLRDGASPDEALVALLADDAGRDTRQVGMVDARGRSAAHTGSGCVEAAGHLTHDGLSIQANMMERPTVWPAMADAYRSTPGELADRLMAALVAAEREGGDVRGRQSAAILVVPATGPAWATRYDLRVEDSRSPLDELARLLRLTRAYEAFDRAEQRATAGDVEAAALAMDDAHALAPDDDMVTLWAALFAARAGRMDDARRWFAEAQQAEARSGEHLRRFAAAGHLPPESMPLIDDLAGGGGPSG
jgi:uncharacterized Ntn-hydrolase superfamily protein